MKCLACKKEICTCYYQTSFWYCPDCVSYEKECFPDETEYTLPCEYYMPLGRSFSSTT